MSAGFVRIVLLSGFSPIALTGWCARMSRCRGITRSATILTLAGITVFACVGAEISRRFVGRSNHSAAPTRFDLPTPMHAPLSVGSRCPAIRADGWLNGDDPATELAGRVVVLDLWSAQ
jgi:hypothetical protein